MNLEEEEEDIPSLEEEPEDIPRAYPMAAMANVDSVEPDNVNNTINQILENVLPNNCFGPNPFIENITKCLQKYISSFEETFKFHLLLYILEFYYINEDNVDLTLLTEREDVINPKKPSVSLSNDTQNNKGKPSNTPVDSSIINEIQSLYNTGQYTKTQLHIQYKLSQDTVRNIVDKRGIYA
jgi:hypothetical protein